MQGKLIVFEGTDGSGKSTQFQKLCELLFKCHCLFIHNSYIPP